MAACIVSFVDLDGIRHSVEVEAEGPIRSIDSWHLCVPQTWPTAGWTDWTWSRSS